MQCMNEYLQGLFYNSIKELLKKNMTLNEIAECLGTDSDELRYLIGDIYFDDLVSTLNPEVNV